MLLPDVVGIVNMGHCARKRVNTMIKFKGDIEKLVSEELSRIKKQYGEKYHTPHEAYGVLKEELEECYEAYLGVDDQCDRFWSDIRRGFTYYEGSRSMLISSMKERAIHLACEGVQVAAVCEKLLQGVEKDE